MRFAACTIVAAVCAVVAGGSADSARTQGGADWTLKPVAAGQKWLRVDVQGDTLYGFRLRGTDFTVTGVKSVRASGGLMPQCSVSGTPATLACDGDLPGGISIFVQLTTSGEGGSYEFALLFSPGDTNLFYVPATQKEPPVPIGGSLGMTSPTAGRVTIRNLSEKQSFQQFEVAPIGFRVRSVSTDGCAVTEGGGVACQGNFRPGAGVVIRFATDAVEGEPSAVLLGQGTQTGFINVQEGDACPDLLAQLASVQAQADTVKSQIAIAERQLSGARHSLGNRAFEKARARVRSANSALDPLRARLTALTRAIRGRDRKLKSCEAGAARKAAAATTCDNEWKAVGRTDGTLGGLVEALSVERRVAARARAAVPPIKHVGPRGGPGWRPAIAHLNVLIALPARTKRALGVARARAGTAYTAALSCYHSLTQD